MSIREIIDKLRNQGKDKEEIPDDETRDKFLRSLRRERRTQMEEVEKAKLIKEIAAFKKDKMRKELFGIKSKIVKQKAIKAGKAKKILSNGKSMLSNNSFEKPVKTGFLGKIKL